MSTEYMLTLQFPEQLIGLDGLIEVEEMLRRRLEPEVIVDGHDIGSGEGNIFIITKDPRYTFELVKQALSGDHLSAVKVAYRTAMGTMEDNTYHLLWPPGLEEFRVK